MKDDETNQRTDYRDYVYKCEPQVGDEVHRVSMPALAQTQGMLKHDQATRKIKYKAKVPPSPREYKYMLGDANTRIDRYVLAIRVSTDLSPTLPWSIPAGYLI